MTLTYVIGIIAVALLIFLAGCAIRASGIDYKTTKDNWRAGE